MKPKTIAVVGAAETTRMGRIPDMSVIGLHADAALNALADCGLKPSDIDGVATAGASPVDLAHYLGITPTYADGTSVGGCSFMLHVRHAAAAINEGLCNTVLITHGESGRSRVGAGRFGGSASSLAGQFEMPYGPSGPPTMFTIPVLRYMKTYGVTEEDLAMVAVVQREWAAKNPHAVYRAPLTMEEYLAAPLVADPLSRYDCVPVVAGAQAIIVARPDRAPKGRPGVRVRAHRASYNYDNQEGDGLQTGISTFAAALWQEAGVRPDDIDVASIYDDYPTMVLAQANDLGLIPGNDLARFCRVTIGEKRFPVNTWGGMLSAGQPGGHAGGLNGISEAVLQLQHRAGERQVKDARLAVTTGYGMTMYRYGGTAAAAILERVE